MIHVETSKNPNCASVVVTLFTLFLSTIVCLSFWIGGYYKGKERSVKEWNQWAVENNWSHYDTNTGKLILHDKEYQDNLLEKFFPELKKNIINEDINVDEGTFF